MNTHGRVLRSEAQLKSRSVDGTALQVAYEYEVLEFSQELIQYLDVQIHSDV